MSVPKVRFCHGLLPPFSDQNVRSTARFCFEVCEHGLKLLLSQASRVLTEYDTFQLPFGPFILPVWLTFLSEFGLYAALNPQSDS